MSLLRAYRDLGSNFDTLCDELNIEVSSSNVYVELRQKLNESANAEPSIGNICNEILGWEIFSKIETVFYDSKILSETISPSLKESPNGEKLKSILNEFNNLFSKGNHNINFVDVVNSSLSHIPFTTEEIVNIANEKFISEPNYNTTTYQLGEVEIINQETFNEAIAELMNNNLELNLNNGLIDEICNHKLAEILLNVNHNNSQWTSFLKLLEKDVEENPERLSKIILNTIEKTDNSFKTELINQMDSFVNEDDVNCNYLSEALLQILQIHTEKPEFITELKKEYEIEFNKKLTNKNQHKLSM